MHTRQIIIGIATLSTLVVSGTLAVRGQFKEKPDGLGDVLHGITRWVSGVPEEYIAVSAVDLMLSPGDPIFFKRPDGSFLQIGRVRNHFAPPSGSTESEQAATTIMEHATRKASVVLYDDEVDRAFPDGFMLEYHTTPTSLDWVVRTMVTPERQKEIAGLIFADWEQHREKMISRMQPVIEASVAKAVSAIEAELPNVMNSHRSDFAKLADRYQVEVIRSQIVPLVRSEILPIVQEEIRPLSMELGKELWDRVSLWSFTWRYLYDVSPLPQKNAVKLEFDRFIKEEVTPALARRSDEFVTLTERILKRISRSEKVRGVIRENLNRIATDDELQSIVWAVVQEAVINNRTLRESLRDYWASSEVQDAMSVASTSFEPTARAIGDAIFGSRESGVSSEFARVVRSQILMKDRRWLVIVPKKTQQLPQPISAHGRLVMYAGTSSMPYPIEFEGAEQSPLTQLQDPE